MWVVTRSEVLLLGILACESQDFKLLVSADASDDGMNVSELPSMTSEKNILMPATSLNEIVSDCTT